MEQNFYHCMEQHLGKKIADHLKMCQSGHVFPLNKYDLLSMPSSKQFYSFGQAS